MQTLIFNTTTKSIKVYENYTSESQKILMEMSSIPTVKVCEGFYEVIQSDEFEKKISCSPFTNFEHKHGNYKIIWT